MFVQIPCRIFIRPDGRIFHYIPSHFINANFVFADEYPQMNQYVQNEQYNCNEFSPNGYQYVDTDATTTDYDNHEELKNNGCQSATFQNDDEHLEEELINNECPKELQDDNIENDENDEHFKENLKNWEDWSPPTQTCNGATKKCNDEKLDSDVVVVEQFDKDVKIDTNENKVFCIFINHLI